jgi:hypothetical protein
MRIDSINLFSPAPPVARATPVSPISRDGRTAPIIAKGDARDERRKRDPIKAATDPAASTSSATRGALDKLQLGG